MVSVLSNKLLKNNLLIKKIEHKVKTKTKTHEPLQKPKIQKERQTNTHENMPWIVDWFSFMKKPVVFVFTSIL